MDCCLKMQIYSRSALYTKIIVYFPLKIGGSVKMLDIASERLVTLNSKSMGFTDTGCVLQ